MRNTVVFAIPAIGWPVESADEPFSDVLRAQHATWFPEILKRIDWLTIEPTLGQEDWGVVAFANDCANKLAFWIGLSFGEDDDWMAHVHHGSFAWLQRVTRTGKEGRERLAVDLDRALREAGATTIRWYDERDTGLDQPADHPL